MRLHGEANLFTRLLMAIFGLTLIGAALASTYHDWPLVLAQKLLPVGFALALFLAIPLGLLVVIWAIIGEKRDWILEGDHLVVRALSLTSWKSKQKININDIKQFRLRSVDHQSENTKGAAWIEVYLDQNQRLSSPVSDKISDVLEMMEALKAKKEHLQENDPHVPLF